MRARGDLNVLHEPFLYHYYLNRSERMFPDFEPEPSHPRTYAETREMIIKAAKDGPVFFKDMAYYVVEDCASDRAFMTGLTHAFLVREPAEAIVSYARRDPKFTLTELGFEAQFRLYRVLQGMGMDPLVITADQLRQNPEATLRRYWEHIGLSFAPHAFEWDGEIPAGWEAVAGWHTEVLNQGAIQPPEEGRDAREELHDLDAPFTDYDRHHRPFYNALREIAENQAHQK